MNKEELIELIDAVDSINEKIWEQVGNDSNRGILCITYASNWLVYVEWNDTIIWNQEDDDREWLEALPAGVQSSGDEYVPAHYESWEPFLRKKMNEIIQQLQLIKL